MPKSLTQQEIITSLAALPGWSGDQSGLSKMYRFTDFRAAMAFIQAAAPAIDAGNHHPEWTNVYNRISVTLRTHDAGNLVTELDVALAQLLDAFAAKFPHVG